MPLSEVPDFRSLEHHEAAAAAYLADPLRFQGIAMWPGLGGFFGFRPGGLTIIAGRGGAGKTTLATQMLLQLNSADPHKGCAMYSPEMSEVDLYIQLARQAAGKAIDDAALRIAVHKTMSWRIWDFGHKDRRWASHTELLDSMGEVSMANNIHWLVIDSMTTIRGQRNDDWNGQKNFMDALSQVAHTTSLHIILLAHIGKQGNSPTDKTGDFSLRQIRGAGEITDLADNVLLLKQAKRKNGEKYGVLVREKERNSPGRTMDETELSFDIPSQQFLPPMQNPRHYADIIESTYERRKAQKRPLVDAPLKAVK